MSDYSPVWPHGDIRKVFSGIYIVCGTNITHYQGMTIQHSRNMTIIESSGDLTLINSVRLGEEGLKQLESLGRVKHVMSIGAFHGRDDSYYCERYNATLWTVQEHSTASKYQIHRLNDKDELPIKKAHFHMFNQANPAEGFIFIHQEEGIIITCDSIKNWIKIDEFFNEETAARALASGEVSKARISPIWIQATGIQKGDFAPLLKLKFKHLISAHGDVLFNTAYQDIQKSVEQL